MRRRRSIHILDTVSMVITIGVVLFISFALLSIIVGGIPYLKDAFASKETRFAIGLSIYTATISTFVIVLLTIPCAYALTRTKMPFKRVAQVVMELPLSLPYLVLGLCLLIVFSSDFGKALKEMGFQIVFDKKGIIMAQIMVNLPFAIRLMKTSMAEIDTRLEFIAGTLGASRLKRFTTILLPLCKPSVIMLIILVWSRALGEFGATLMLVGVTRMKTETLPASIYLNISTGDNGMAMASAIILLMIAGISIVVTTFIDRKNKNLNRVKDMVHI